MYPILLFFFFFCFGVGVQCRMESKLSPEETLIRPKKNSLCAKEKLNKERAPKSLHLRKIKETKCPGLTGRNKN
jgi:hypothetical protein